MENQQLSNYIKIRPVGAKLFHADTHDEANSRSSKSYERAQKFN